MLLGTVDGANTTWANMVWTSAAALLAACFSLPGGVLRAIGGVICLTSTARTR